MRKKNIDDDGENNMVSYNPIQSFRLQGSPAKQNIKENSGIVVQITETPD